MIRSMTGYGQAEQSAAGNRIRVELKSVNHRYLEQQIRLPREWMGLEDAIKRTVQLTMKRGRIDVFVSLDPEQVAAQTARIDWTRAEAFVTAAQQLKTTYGLSGELSVSDLLAVPDLIQVDGTEEGDFESVEAATVQAVAEAAAKAVLMRETEGRHLAADLADKLAELTRWHAQIAEAAQTVVQEYRRKLADRLVELEVDTALHADRIAAEVALYADRCSIDEELTRLSSHFQQFTELLQEREPVGRKLDFLLQEMNREANTIGSKAGFIPISRAVVELKAGLEKIREQAQNIE